MKLVLIPILAALVGVPSLSTSMAAAEREVPPNADGEAGTKPGDANAQREAELRQRQEAQRQRDAQTPGAEGQPGVAPGTTPGQQNEAQRRREETERRRQAGEPSTAGDRNTNPDEMPNRRDNEQRPGEIGNPMTDGDSTAMQARLHERVARLKTERPELFKRLDLDRNGELSTEELRRPRELYQQQMQARRGAGNQPRPDGQQLPGGQARPEAQESPNSRPDQPERPGRIARPDQAETAVRPVPPADADERAVAEFLFGD